MITEGYLARHYQGRADGRGPALIDVAQDHALHLLHEAGVFELGAILKGGTAIRKFPRRQRRAFLHRSRLRRRGRDHRGDHPRRA